MVCSLTNTVSLLPDGNVIFDGEINDEDAVQCGLIKKPIFVPAYILISPVFI